MTRQQSARPALVSLVATVLVLGCSSGASPTAGGATPTAGLTAEPSSSAREIPTFTPTPTPTAEPSLESAPPPIASPTPATPSAPSSHEEDELAAHIGDNGWIVAVPVDLAWVSPEELQRNTEGYTTPTGDHQLLVGKARLDPGGDLASYAQGIGGYLEDALNAQLMSTEEIKIDGVQARLCTYRLTHESLSLGLLASRVHGGVGSYLLLMTHAGDDVGHKALFDRITGGFAELPSFSDF